MWICLNKAFLSIVHKDCAEDELLVRARREGDIERVFPGAKAQFTTGTDYAYRAVLKRHEVALAISGELFELDYGNFKDSCRDHELHNAYMGFWHVHGRLQKGGPYGHYPRGLKKSF
jgi:hypothetical protein